MSKKSIVPLVVALVAVVAFAVLVGKPGSNTASSAGLDAFGRCLASRNATMYGAEWCSHCQNEKKALGSGFRFIDYVECPDNVQLCISKGIEGYPTWILSDGTKLIGEQGIEGLARATGCPVPAAEE